MKEVFRKLNITTSFIPSGCTGYVQVLDVAFNKPIKNRISELADISYEENLEKWEKGVYTVGERRVMLTHWVGQAWREFHRDNPGLIRQTFRKLGLSLAIDGSEDDEIWIKDIPDVKMGDWRRFDQEEDVELIDSNDENNEAIEATNQMNQAMQEMEYVMREEGGVEVENEENRRSDSELEDDE